jgi:3-dehydroquinate dehydratase type II
MHQLTQSILLIGFKHVGKSVIGAALAKKLNVPYVDVDHVIEQHYQNTYQKKLSCRQIMQTHGEAFFRELETIALTKIITVEPSVIALGGGTPLRFENQRLLASYVVVHINAPRQIVLERIMSSGQPAFININENSVESLTKLWDERNKIYQGLATFSIEHEQGVEQSVQAIVNKLATLKKILLLHGANLNWLGKRDKNHYGSLSLNDIETITRAAARKSGYAVIAYQSNHEGDLIDALQLHSGDCCGIIINPGAFTHYSYALYDALVDTQLPIVEVHLSKISEREEWRRTSVTVPAAIKCIEGKKEQGYVEAVEVLVEYLHNAHQ